MTLSSLSGRVDALETSVTFLNQDMLQRPDLMAFSRNNTIWNQQISDISDTVDTLIGQVQNLQNLYVILNQTTSTNLGVLTGHTGLTTGDGVHGHV